MEGNLGSEPLPPRVSTWTDNVPTTTTCFAAGESGPKTHVDTVVATTDGGASWTTQPVPSGLTPFGVACPERSRLLRRCRRDPYYNVAAIATTDGGATWTSLHLPVVGFLTAVACPSTTHCLRHNHRPGREQVVLATTDGGVNGIFNMSQQSPRSSRESRAHLRLCVLPAASATALDL